ncbi:threonine/serine dehydratase [Pseudovibrio exalbescens]|uniref:threonine ammonia-lyase n=1 Tax=Pseudovibrio exalbescens TaxID=197461 RepID=UPI0023665693|nr:threonine/serine dehydratase [Pseudovibrio exalbescens]MDD7910401.1 threonine/serine dehydratase [Pseudovibrio exalbescens]
MSIASSTPLRFQDILEARTRISNHAVHTPLLRSNVLDEVTGGQILIKPECLQRTGSFKFRGAFNRLSMIPAEQRGAGVVACSSGNHAQGVAAAAKLLGMRATIVMPSDAPELKRRRTAALGAEVVLYDRLREDRDAIAHGIASETGGTFVHPFNDPGVIAGQGTVGLELSAQARAAGLELEGMAVCTGGGGLTSGIALALAELEPECVLHTCEPEGFDDYARSLAASAIVNNEQAGGSVCDAVLTQAPGDVGFEILRKRRVVPAIVTDEEALKAVAFAFTELKLVVEPGGAVALAAVLFGKVPVKDRCVGVTLSGGNIDPGMMARALSL